MPRQSAPRFLPDRNLWYAQVKGRRYPLLKGPDTKKNRAEAVRLFRRLMVELEGQGGAPAGRCSLGHLVADYLDDLAARAERGEIRPQRRGDVLVMLRPLLARHGGLDAAEMGAKHLDAFLGSSGWSEHTRSAFMRCLVAAYRWGKRHRLVTCDPPRPSPGSQPRPQARRPEGAIPDAVTARKIVECCSTTQFKDFALFVLLTGARPGEVARIEAKHLRASGVIVLSEHKTSKKTGRPRKIAVGNEAGEILTRLAIEHPEGPLFLNTRGRPWTRVNWAQAFDVARAAAGVDSRITLYSFRHAYATIALKRGMSIETVAKLLGHSDSSMTSRTYSDIDSDDAWLRRAAEDATGEPPPS